MKHMKLYFLFCVLICVFSQQLFAKRSYGVQTNFKEKNIGFSDLTTVNASSYKDKTSQQKQNIVVSTRWLQAKREGKTHEIARKYVDLSPYVNQRVGANVITIGPEPECDATYQALPAIISEANFGDELHLAAGTFSSDLAHFDIVDKSLMIIGGYSQDCQTLTPNTKTTLELSNANDEVFDINPVNQPIEINLVNLIIKGGGGGVSSAGGIRLHAPSSNGSATLNLVNSLVRDSHGLFAGGIRVIDGTVNITGDSVVLDNQSKSFGGGISCINGTINIENGLIHQNHASTHGAGLYMDNCNLVMHGYPENFAAVTFNKAPNGCHWWHLCHQ